MPTGAESMEIWMDGIQPHGIHKVPHHVIQAITSEGLAQGPYEVARGGVEPANHSPLWPGLDWERF